MATADQAPKEVAELKDAPPELEDRGTRLNGMKASAPLGLVHLRIFSTSIH